MAISSTNMRNKQVSKRRWKKRCAAGRLIPKLAIVQYRLDKWFVFIPANVNMDAYYAAPKTP